MEGLGNSPVEDAIKLLNISRKDTNARLVRHNLELTRNPDGTVLLTNKETGEKQTFEIEIVENAEHPRFDGAYDLLGETFNSEELDPKEIMADQMKGLRYGETIPTGAKAVIFTLSKIVESTDENGEKIKHKEVVGTLDGGLIDLEDETGKFTGESIFMVFYVASKTDEEDTTKNYRQYGFGRELMISAYEYAKKEAEKRKKKFIGAAGECTYTSRNFWEKMNWKRCYMRPKGDASNNWKEIVYVQPPLDFNLETGEVEEGSGDAPEHFMAHIFELLRGEQDPEKIIKKLISIVNGFYRTNNFIAPEAFGGKTEAYEKHYALINERLENFAKQFEGMEVSFFSEDEIKKGGLAVENYYPGGDEEREMLAKTKSAERIKTDSNF